MYRFLGGLYIMEVDAEQLAQLKKMTFPEVEGNSDADQDLREGYALVRDYLKEFPDGEPEKTEKLDDLAADYAKVFLAAGDATGRAAFPYESVYVDKRHRVHALQHDDRRKTDPSRPGPRILPSLWRRPGPRARRRSDRFSASERYCETRRKDRVDHK